MTYHKNSLLKTKLQTNGTFEEYFYDSQDQLEEIKVTKSTDVLGSDYIHYEYDNMGRPLVVTSKEGGENGQTISINSFTYDSFSRVLSDSQAIGNLASKTTNYSFDDINGKQIITYPSGQVVEFLSDTSDRIEFIKRNGVQVRHNFYQGSKPIRRLLGIDDNAVIQNLIYGSGHELLQASYSKNTTDIFSYNYDYDKTYNKLYEKRNHDGGIGDRYAYDSVNNLIDTYYNVPSPETNGDNYQERDRINYDKVDGRLNF